MKKFEIIVAGTDFSPLADIAVQTAIEIGGRVGAKRVHVVHVLDMSVMNAPYPFAYTSADMERIEQRRRSLAREKLDRIQSTKMEITREVRPGIPSRDLAEVASEIRADLVVMASHGYGALKRALLGSVTASLIRMAHCAVLVVGEKRHATRFDNVLAAVDLSAVSKRVLSHAVGLAAPGGRVRALSLYDTPLVSVDEGVLPGYFSPHDLEQLRQERERAVLALAKEVKTDGVTVESEALAKAPAANAILDASELLGADLIAVGTSGHNAWHRMVLGSTATKVLAEAKMPVLVVPHDATDETL
jgi:nucleotide-binding universal stress UspA family protein